MYKIRKETRPERDDVFGFYKTVKKLNDTQTEIVEVEEQFKETTKVQLEQELTAIHEQLAQLQSQIDELTNKQADLNTMIAMIDNYTE